MEIDQSNTMFGPLVFDNTNIHLEKSLETKCLLCEDSFNLSLSLPIFLAHIFDVHNIVIEDVQNIEKLDEYVLYWRGKFKCIPLEQLIPSVNVDSVGQRYYLMSGLLKEDKQLRHRLKLEYALSVQETERIDNSFVRACLFCKLQFEGTRHGYLEHLSSQHNLQLGNPQNLVFIEALVEKLDKTLLDLKCIYCQKVFPDRNILKEHMRKKIHKRINPTNVEYDKYYIVNYLEEDKSWQLIQKEDDRLALPRELEANSDEEYSDWQEKEDQISCLFCDSKETNINLICLHMEADHDFDFALLTENLSFYQKIKLINYMRRQIHNSKCIFCDQSFENSSQLLEHVANEGHNKLPEIKVYDQPEFYFPTYENDAFLYLIDDVED